MLSCFLFFEWCNTRDVVMLCFLFKSETPDECCDTAHQMCTLAHKKKNETRLRATSFTPASEEVEGVLASPRQTLLKASHLDLGQALYLDLRHICLVVELAAMQTHPTKTNPFPRTLTNRSWRTQMFSQSRNRSYATITLGHNYQRKPS